VALELARDGADLAAVVSFHGVLTTQIPAVRGKLTARVLVIPGRCKASNPESRDSPMRNCASEVWR